MAELRWPEEKLLLDLQTLAMFHMKENVLGVKGSLNSFFESAIFL